MKISILLPYKENYSIEYAGAVSIFVCGVNKFSKFNKNIKVYKKNLAVPRGIEPLFRG